MGVQVAESDPTGRAPNTPGAKLDSGKTPLLRGCLAYFPLALAEVAKVSEYGAKKYTWKGWETVPDGINRYGDALARHLLQDGEDKDTGLLHASHCCWNSLARLELMLRERQDYRKAELERARTETVAYKTHEHAVRYAEKMIQERDQSLADLDLANNECREKQAIIEKFIDSEAVLVQECDAARAEGAAWEKHAADAMARARKAEDDLDALKVRKVKSRALA